jgi:hypothetical protein
MNTLCLLLLTAFAVFVVALVMIYHFSRPLDELSPLAEGLKALRSVQTRPGLTP